MSGKPRAGRRALLRLLGPQAQLQNSFLPGRCGYLITTHRALPGLRRALTPRWACRLFPIHAKSGRYLLEPSTAYLCRQLQRDQPEHWWGPAHQQAAQTFFEPVRSDRIRRLLRPTSAGHASWRHGFRRLRLLALRLESLHVTPRPDKHWRGLAEAFDELWRTTPLHALAADPLLAATIAQLGRLRACARRAREL